MHWPTLLSKFIQIANFQTYSTISYIQYRSLIQPQILIHSLAESDETAYYKFPYMLRENENDNVLC